jgi:hypothetical protein
MNTKDLIGSHIGNIIIFNLRQRPGITYKGQIINGLEVSVSPGSTKEGSLLIPGSWIRDIISMREAIS